MEKCLGFLQIFCVMDTVSLPSSLPGPRSRVPRKHRKGAANPGMLLGGGGPCRYYLGQERHGEDMSLKVLSLFKYSLGKR